MAWPGSSSAPMGMFHTSPGLNGNSGDLHLQETSALHESSTGGTGADLYGLSSAGYGGSHDGLWNYTEPQSQLNFLEPMDYNMAMAQSDYAVRTARTAAAAMQTEHVQVKFEPSDATANVPTDVVLQQQTQQYGDALVGGALPVVHNPAPPAIVKPEVQNNANSIHTNAQAPVPVRTADANEPRKQLNSSGSNSSVSSQVDDMPLPKSIRRPGASSGTAGTRTRTGNGTTSNASTGNSSDGDSENGVNRKSKHRYTERRRRQRINEAVGQIQTLLNCSKTDKAGVLMQAAKALKRDRGLESQVRALEDENAELREQLQRLSVQPNHAHPPTPNVASADSKAPPLVNGRINFDTVYRQNGMPMCIATLEMQVIDMNAAFARMIGAPENGDMGPVTCMRLSPVEDFYKLFNVMQRLMSGEQQAGQMVKRMKTLAGREFDVLTTLVLVREDGAPKYVMATVMPLKDTALATTPQLQPMSVPSASSVASASSLSSKPSENAHDSGDQHTPTN
jgi:PAS domain S-box-containing protein